MKLIILFFLLQSGTPEDEQSTFQLGGLEHTEEGATQDMTEVERDSFKGPPPLPHKPPPQDLNDLSSPEDNSAPAEVFDLPESSSEGVTPDMDPEVLFIKLKEAQYRNAVSEAELAKVKARVSVLICICSVFAIFKIQWSLHYKTCCRYKTDLSYVTLNSPLRY